MCQLSDSFSHLPWAVLGDFNIARFIEEKLGGSPLSIKKLKDFNDCISYCSLSDIASKGSSWSWTNKNNGQQRIIGRFDRILLPHGLICSLNHIIAI